MKYCLSFICYIISSMPVNGQTKAVDTTIKYNVVVSFGSMCCGTASDDFLKAFVKKFNCKNKVTLETWLVAGCGREGEFSILFNLADLSAPKKTEISAALKALIPEQNKKNKTSNGSSGPISIAYSLPLSSFDNCRVALAKWKP